MLTCTTPRHRRLPLRAALNRLSSWILLGAAALASACSGPVDASIIIGRLFETLWATLRSAPNQELAGATATIPSATE